MDDGSVKVTDCPTEYMWADVNSKPLQGTLFKVMRDKLMGCGVDYEDDFWNKTADIAPTSILKNSARGTQSPSKVTVHRAQECVG